MIHFEIIYIGGKRRYQCIEEATHTSERTGKTKTMPVDYLSNGANVVPDLASDAWWWHDILVEDETWDDGSECSNYQASLELHDILKKEGRWFRCKSWGISTFLFGEVRKLWR